MSSPIASRGSAAHERQVFAVLFAGFVVTGVVTTILGPSLPVLIGRWSLDDAHAGIFFTTQFLGSLAGTGATSALLAWKGYRPALFVGFAAMALGIAALNASQQTLALAAAATSGFGFGAVSPATNLWVGEAGGPRRAAALNLLNLAWGIGALCCHPLVFAGIKSNSFSSLLYEIAGAACILGVIVLLMKFDSRATAKMNEDAQAENTTTGWHAAGAIAALFFLYVGTESGISGWAAAYSKRLGTVSGTTWALAPMFFWAALLVGRGSAPMVLSRVKEGSLVLAGLIVTAVGTAALLQAASQAMVIAALLLAGLGLSSLYPIFIAWLSKWYGARARKIGGALFLFAALGGSVMPWLVGFVSTRAGSLRVGLLVPLAGCFVMLGVLANLHRQRLV